MYTYFFEINLLKGFDMQRKLFVIILFLCHFITVYSSQNKDSIARCNLTLDESLFFDEQIRKLQQLQLPCQQESLYFNFKKMMNHDVISTPLVGRRDIKSNRIYPSDNYHSHDDARKILRDINQYICEQQEQRLLLSMAGNLQVGQSRLYRMPFKHE